MSDDLNGHDIYGISGFVEHLYAAKDTMHDWSHIVRCFAAVEQIIRHNTLRCNYPLLVAGLILHGIIYEKENEVCITDFLMTRASSAEETARIVHIAWDSQKDSRPETLEGGILHDAHLLEGDENFIITKTLITGTARGQKLDQTVKYFFDNVMNFKPCFYFEPTAEKYKRRLHRAEEYFSSLQSCAQVAPDTIN